MDGRLGLEGGICEKNPSSHVILTGGHILPKIFSLETDYEPFPP